MSDYRPDRWCVVKITPKDKNPIYKVFAIWNGNYLSDSGESWKLNSGITKVIKEGSEFLFHGYSGSIYRCNEIYYGISMYGASVLDDIINRAEAVGGTIDILPEETNWLEIDYED